MSETKQVQTMAFGRSSLVENSTRQKYGLRTPLGLVSRTIKGKGLSSLGSLVESELSSMPGLPFQAETNLVKKTEFMAPTSPHLPGPALHRVTGVSYRVCPPLLVAGTQG